MKDENKTKRQLINELLELRQHIYRLEKLEIQRKQAEKSIERLNHQNELILNAAGEGIFGLDIQGKHTFVNPSAAQMLGYTVNELIGRHSHTLWHYKKSDGSSYPVVECPIYAAYKDGGVHHRDDEVFLEKGWYMFPGHLHQYPYNRRWKYCWSGCNVQRHHRAETSGRGIKEIVR
jgi:PAS domain-containing protein